VGVAKLWEDLRLGVISLSNLVIAGSPRNVFKYGGREAAVEVGRPRALGKPRPLDPTKAAAVAPRQTRARKGAGSRGTQPRPPAKVPNSSPVGKVGGGRGRGGRLKSNHPLKKA